MTSVGWVVVFVIGAVKVRLTTDVNEMTIGRMRGTERPEKIRFPVSRKKGMILCEDRVKGCTLQQFHD